MEIGNFCSEEDIIKRIKKVSSGLGENICKPHIGQWANVKNILKLNRKNPNHLIKIWAKDKKIHFNG